MYNIKQVKHDIGPTIEIAKGLFIQSTIEYRITFK